MDCTQVLISSPSRDISPDEKKENRIVAKLTINGITHDIFNRENTIGRGDSCDIILKNEAISSRHAIIEANDCQEHILYDLGSTNKTKLGKTTLKPNVRYFINDGANLTFADELAVYKYVSNSPEPKGTRNFTIPATPEKSETSRLSSPEELEVKDDDIIDSSDLDIFDESFEEEICTKRNVNSHSLPIKEESMNGDDDDDDGGGSYRIADKKSESHHTENSKFTTNKNKEITSFHNLNETLTTENSSGNETLKEGYRLVDETCLSIYDIPTQTLSENGDLFGETNKSIFEVETQQHILDSSGVEGRGKEFEQTSREDKEKKDISDIQEADTLDPADYPLIDMDCSEKTHSAIAKETTKHLEVKEHELKEVMYFDEDELHFKERKVNEMNTQDMLCKDRDSDDEMEVKADSLSNKMNNQPISPKEGDIKFTASLEEKSIAVRIIESDNSESAENKIGLDLLCDKECPDNNDRINLTHKEDNIFTKDNYKKYQNEKLDKDVFKLLNQKASSCKSVDNLFNNKEGDEENINYKEKKIKLSQMMKLSSESASSQRDATVRSTLDSKVNNSLSELMIQPLFNQTVLSTSKENNIFSDKSSFSETKNTDHEDPALLVNLSLSNMQFQSAESSSRSSPNLGNITNLCKTKSEFENVDEEKVNVIASSILNKSNEALKSLNDSDSCNLMTQPVLNAEDIRDKEEIHFGKKKKYTELLNKAEDMIPKKEDLSKSKAAKFEKENQIKSVDDIDMCDLMTQPILITEEVQRDKVYGKKKVLELLNKAEGTRLARKVVDREGDENRTIETNICDLKTQPFLTAENIGNKEENKIFGSEKVIKPLLSEVEPIIPEIKKVTKAKQTADIEEKLSQNDIDICDLMTQPVVIPAEYLHDKKESKICKLEKELKSSNKTEDVIPEREKLAKVRKTPIEGEESDQKSLLNDTHICDLMTVDVITPENDKEGDKVCRSGKEVELRSKLFYGFEEVDVGNMLTQPVLSSDQNIKHTNQQTLSPNKNLNDSMDNMLTQPILLPNQFSTSETANDGKKKTYSSKNLVVAGENQRMCNTSINDLSISNMLTQPILSPDVKNEKSVRIDIADDSVIIKKNFVRVDILSNSQNSSNNCGYLKANILTNDKIDQNLNEESISDMLTQPVILDDVSPQNIKKGPDEEIDSVKIFTKREHLEQSLFNKKETDSTAFNASKAELPQNEPSPSIVENNYGINNSYSGPIQREAAEGDPKDYKNMLTKSFKKKFSKQVIVSRKSEATSPSNISDNENNTNKIMNFKEYKECENQVKESCSSNHNITSAVDDRTCEDNQAVMIIPKKRKNITLRLKKDKEKKPSEIDSVRKESLIIALESINKELEVNPAHSDNVSDIDIPAGKVAKLQKHSKLQRDPVVDGDKEAEKGENEINILENRSISDENNSTSCKSTDISSGKNFTESSIGIPESSNNKVTEPISRKNISINTFTSVINNDTNDVIEGKKVQPEMGRGKRRRTKKIFQDFCTDVNAEKIVSDDSQENRQSRRTKYGALDGNNSNAESKKISSADRKRKNSKNNQEEELKCKENICRPHLKKKCTRLLDTSSSIAAEQDNSVDINLKETRLGLQNKIVENENIGKYDQNATGESDSTIETSHNLLTSHIECANLGLLETSNCLERWNSPLNTTKMRTYSKKKSLITFAGEQSNSSSLHLNEWNKNTSTGDRAVVKDSSFPTASTGEEVKSRSSISESKVSCLPVIVSSKKTNAPKTKPLMESDGNSISNVNVLKREHEDDNNTKLSHNKRSKTKKVNNAPNDNKKSSVKPSKPKPTVKSEIIKEHISPIVNLKRYIHSEHVQISVKNTKDKEMSPITSKKQRKTKHSKEAKKDDEPFNEEEHNFPKSSTPIKTGGTSSKAVIDQNIEAEESFAASFSSNKSDESSPARRSARKRKLNCRLQPFFGPCENVLFTGYSDAKAPAVINKLGGQVVDCPKSCTVLVTDKVRRTVKFLCALALGRPIVSPQWLASSKTSLTFLDHDKYLLKDKEAEKQFSFTLKESLAKARKAPLLQGKSIFVTNSVKPPPVDMKSIVECSGGTFLTKAPTIWPQNSVIISCNEDKSVCNKFKKKQSNLPIVSTEFILSGILQQDFNPDKYIL